MKRRLNHEEIINTYLLRRNAGLDISFRAISEVTGVHHVTVGRILKKAGYSFRDYVIPEEEKNRILDDYVSGTIRSLVNLASKYHRGTDSVKKVLVEANVYDPFYRKGNDDPAELIDFGMKTPSYDKKIWKSPEIVLRVPNGRGGYTSKTYYDVTYAPDDFGFPQFGCENAKEAMKNAKR